MAHTVSQCDAEFGRCRRVADSGKQSGGEFVETGNESWHFKGRDDDHTSRARAVSATPADSKATSATSRARRSKGSLLDADGESHSNAD